MSPANIESHLKTASPLIGQAVAIGDAPPLQRRADRPRPRLRAGLGASRTASRASRSRSSPTRRRLREAIQAAVDEANAKMARVEQIKKFTILPERVGARRRRADADDEAEAQADRREVRRGDRGALLGLARLEGERTGGDLPAGGRAGGAGGRAGAGAAAQSRARRRSRWRRRAQRSRARWSGAASSARARAAVGKQVRAGIAKPSRGRPGSAAGRPASSSTGQAPVPILMYHVIANPPAERPAPRALRRPEDLRPADGVARAAGLHRRQPEPGLRRLVQGRRAAGEAGGRSPSTTATAASTSTRGRTLRKLGWPGVLNLIVRTISDRRRAQRRRWSSS